MRSALGGALAVVLIAGATARAEDAEDELTFEQKLIRQLMGGLGANVGNDIEYRERSPLVIPPSTELPTPEGTVAVENNPAWPKDSDTRRRKETIAASKAISARSRDGDVLDPARPLPRDALNGNPRLETGPRPAPTAPGATNDNEAGRRLTPTELGYKGGIFGSLFGSKSNEQTRFSEEPPRTNLTQPPSGYQTPSPTAPYGINTPKERPKALKPEDIAVGKTN